jgi:hypothetical protein
MDAGFFIPPRRLLVAALYLAGGSKGLILGWLSALLLFKQLRGDRHADPFASGSETANLRI